MSFLLQNNRLQMKWNVAKMHSPNVQSTYCSQLWIAFIISRCYGIYSSVKAYKIMPIRLLLMTRLVRIYWFYLHKRWNFSILKFSRVFLAIIADPIFIASKDILLNDVIATYKNSLKGTHIEHGMLSVEFSTSMDIKVTKGKYLKVTF